MASLPGHVTRMFMLIWSVICEETIGCGASWLFTARFKCWHCMKVCLLQSVEDNSVDVVFALLTCAVVAEARRQHEVCQGLLLSG